MRYQIAGTVGQWTFYEVTNHGFTGELEDQPLYGFAVGTVETPKGSPKLGELYPSLEHAMVAAVGEKYTGPRGAGGTGVGTAADWFMRMIGAHQLVPVADGKVREIVNEVMAEEGRPLFRRARAIETALGKRGLVIAELNDGR